MVNYLRVVGQAGLIVKHVHVASPSGMEFSAVHYRTHHQRVREGLNRLIPDVDGMLHWSFPIGIFVHYCG